jgi:hypothetical protein
MKNSKSILLFLAVLFCMIPFVQAGVLDELVNISSGLVSAVNVAFDYIVKLIQWINLFALGLIFVLLWIGWFAMIFSVAWAVVKVEPYLEKLGGIYNNLNDWVKGRRKFGSKNRGDE